MSSIQLS